MATKSKKSEKSTRTAAQREATRKMIEANKHAKSAKSKRPAKSAKSKAPKGLAARVARVERVTAQHTHELARHEKAIGGLVQVQRFTLDAMARGGLISGKAAAPARALPAHATRH